MSRSVLRSVLLASCCTTAVACIDTGALKMPSGTGGAAGASYRVAAAEVSRR